MTHPGSCFTLAILCAIIAGVILEIRSGCICFTGRGGHDPLEFDDGDIWFLLILGLIFITIRLTVIGVWMGKIYIFLLNAESCLHQCLDL